MGSGAAGEVLASEAAAAPSQLALTDGAVIAARDPAVADAVANFILRRAGLGAPAVRSVRILLVLPLVGVLVVTLVTSVVFLVGFVGCSWLVFHSLVHSSPQIGNIQDIQ